MTNSKIVLNVMPWFKRGSHERVFTAMICGAVCLTDSSAYLRKEFINQENIVFYDLNTIEQLASMVDDLLVKEEEAEMIAYNGRDIALNKHTWEQRTGEILNILER